MLYKLLLIFTGMMFCLDQGAAASTEVHHNFLYSSQSKDKIEFFWSQPEGVGPWPALVMLHPHQEWPDKIGGAMFVQNGSLAHWTQKGFMTVAISQPGYGASQGTADFCGPRSQQAVTDLIAHLRSLTFIRKDKIFLYGGSRGAVIASMLATRDPLLAGITLKSGVYDLTSAYHSYPWYHPIKLSMIWEMGFYDEAKMRERSALFFADQIKAPLLIIHGTEDDRASIEGAQLFTHKVQASGGTAELLSIDSTHFIPMEKIQAEMAIFMTKHLN